MEGILLGEREVVAPEEVGRGPGTQEVGGGVAQRLVLVPVTLQLYLTLEAQGKNCALLPVTNDENLGNNT